MWRSCGWCHKRKSPDDFPWSSAVCKACQDAGVIFKTLRECALCKAWVPLSQALVSEEGPLCRGTYICRACKRDAALVIPRCEVCNRGLLVFDNTGAAGTICGPCQEYITNDERAAIDTEYKRLIQEFLDRIGAYGSKGMISSPLHRGSSMALHRRVIKLTGRGAIYDLSKYLSLRARALAIHAALRESIVIAHVEKIKGWSEDAGGESL